MEKNTKGHLTVLQKAISLLIGIGTGIIHAILKKKGIDIPMDEICNPATTGGLATGIAGIFFKASGKEEQQ